MIAATPQRVGWGALRISTGETRLTQHIQEGQSVPGWNLAVFDALTESMDDARDVLVVMGGMSASVIRMLNTNELVAHTHERISLIHVHGEYTGDDMRVMCGDSGLGVHLFTDEYIGSFGEESAERMPVAQRHALQYRIGLSAGRFEQHNFGFDRMEWILDVSGHSWAHPAYRVRLVTCSPGKL